MLRNLAHKMIAGLVLLLTCFAVHAAECPASPDELFDRYFREIIVRNPDFAYALGFDESMGYSFPKDSLTDLSEESIQAEYRIARDCFDCLETFDPAAWDASQRLELSILRSYLATVLEGEKFEKHAYAVNPQFGIHTQIITTLIENHFIDNAEDAAAYISRLKQIPRRIDQTLDIMAIQKRRHILPPRPVVQNFIDVLNVFTGVPPDENALLATFSEKLKNAGIKRKTRLDLEQQVQAIIEEDVYPAYRKLIQYTSEDVLPGSDNRDGVWKLPNCAAYYAYCLQQHTTLAIGAEELHLTGLREVRRIQGEIAERLETLGFDTAQPFKQLIRSYRQSIYGRWDPEFFYESTPAGIDEALRDYRRMIKQMEKKLPELFILLPETPIAVTPLPDYLKMSAAQSYHRADLSGKREAAFYTDISAPPPKPNMQTLLIHETVPGHHLQIAIQQENSRLPMYRNLTHFTAFIEGWALYAERLAMENGWSGDVHAEIGYLDAELLRAVRLVVDTGIHHYKWDRILAFEYMADNLGWASMQGVDRYILWPGQACAYTIGELKILELREKAKTDLGERFDIREFHRAILENGAVPLPILEQIVQDYILSVSTNGR